MSLSDRTSCVCYLKTSSFFLRHHDLPRVESPVARRIGVHALSLMILENLSRLRRLHVSPRNFYFLFQMFRLSEIRLHLHLHLNDHGLIWIRHILRGGPPMNRPGNWRTQVPRAPAPPLEDKGR